MAVKFFNGKADARSWFSRRLAAKAWFSPIIVTRTASAFKPAWAVATNEGRQHMMKRNVAGQKVGTTLINATTGAPHTGVATVYVTIDAGTQAVGSVGSGAATDEGHGYFSYAPAQAETDGDLCAFTFEAAGCINRTENERPLPFVSTRLDVNTGAMTNNVIDSGAVATSGATEIAGKVWDELTSGHAVGGSFGEVATNLAAGVNVTKWLGTTVATPTVAGIPKIEVASYLSGTTPLQPTVAGRTLDVTAGGEAGIDWANIGSPTTVVGLSGTTVKTATDVETDTADIQSRIPAALSSGNMKVDVFALQASALAQIAAAIAAKVVTTGSQTIGGILGHVAFALWGKRTGQNGPSLTIFNDAGSPVAEIVQAVATDGATADIPSTLNNP